MSTDLSAPHYVIFSIHPLSRPSYAQIFLSAPRSQIPAAYVPPSKSATNFHTHTKRRAEL